ncbi:MAG: NAD(P)-dependent oxidoreductase [Burkholderiales bacterium]|nr:NAD(P)-dependent oxidoreductase [Burkholderiales bacterium]
MKSGVGLVGLGLVGTALISRLRAAGFDPQGWDHDGAALTRCRQGGGRTVDSAAALGRECAVVILAVFDTAGVIDVLEGEDGILAGGTPQAVIDCSTGDADTLQALATRLAARGIDFIEAPLSGSSAQIAAGEALMLLGGEARAIAAQDTLLCAIAARRTHVGGAGMGARAKLATNLVLGLNRAALAEGMAFAESLGIAPADFLELILNSPARSEAAVQKGVQMVREDFAPRSRVRQHLKDVELMLAAARANGRRLPLTDAHAALLRTAVDQGDGDLDNAAILRTLRRARA